MTATVAKKATAAELRANFAHYYCSVHASHGCTQPCDWLAELDVLLAAARAEAVADAGDDAVELREALLSLSARPDDPNRPHINDIIGACIRAARAEAVAPVLAVLRQLVAACHKCANCESPAMRKAANEALYCDAHGYYLSGTQMDDHRIAAPLRAALALLAADQSGEKAGKP